MRRLRRDDPNDIDDIFGDDDAPAPRRQLRPVSNGSDNVQVHFVTPRNFNDAQEIADKFKRSVPVILNLQSASTRPLQAPDRLRLRPHLRARRRHAANRRQDLPADARRTSRSRPRRRPASSRRASSTSPSAALALGGERCSHSGSLGFAADEGWFCRIREHGRRDGARPGRACRRPGGAAVHATPAPGGPQALAAELGASAVACSTSWPPRSDLIVLAVKPKRSSTAAAEPARASRARSSRCSERRPVATSRRRCPRRAVLRTMPNVGVEIGQGIDLPRAAAGSRRAGAGARAARPHRDRSRAARGPARRGDGGDGLLAAPGSRSPREATAAGRRRGRPRSRARQAVDRAHDRRHRRAAAAPRRRRRSAGSSPRREAAPRPGSTRSPPQDAAAAYEGAVGAALERMAGQAMSPLATLLVAIDRYDVADYVDALFTIYMVMILLWIVISWVVSFRGSLPYNTALRAVTDFIEQCVDAVPEPVPADPAADRRRRHGPRPEPDHRDHRADDRPRDHRRADRRVSAAVRGAPARCWGAPA